jgi:hypothetical protein
VPTAGRHRPRRDKVAAIAIAQKDGRVVDTFPAEELLMLVTGLSVLGAPDLGLGQVADLQRRRPTVVETVRMLAGGGVR